MRVLAVDHGEKRIGLAISDPNGTIANPLTVVKHVSRALDAAQVATVASEQDAGLIIVGQSFDEDGQPNLAGRRAARFAEASNLIAPTPNSKKNRLRVTASGIYLRLSMTRFPHH